MSIADTLFFRRGSSVKGGPSDPVFVMGGLQSDYFTELALGNIPGRRLITKFGEAPSGIQLTPTDIWSRANSTPTQQIWLAPTAARIHTIISTSSEDAPGGTGASHVRVYGLVDWDTKEVSELITLAGDEGVDTENSYVIIHRMEAIAQATTVNAGVNVGTISATAQEDTTVTALILAGDGQTEMAIYGVPSCQEAILHRWSANIDKTAAAAVTADFQLRVNANPNVQTLGFVRKEDLSPQSTGSNEISREYKGIKFSGPCIIKVQATASAADVDGHSGFELELVDV